MLSHSKVNQGVSFFRKRWMKSDYPGGEARFQPNLMGKDIAIFILLPLVAVFFTRSIGAAEDRPKPAARKVDSENVQTANGSGSQVIVFGRREAGNGFSPLKRPPGTLIRVRLLNVVESYSGAPVHVRIMDSSLGASFFGGSVIGDAAADSSFGRMNISFRIARTRNGEADAFSLSGRALSLNGTLGLEAKKKEGAFARAVLGTGATGAAINTGEAEDFKSILLKALTAGLAQEYGSDAQVERNRAQVLTLDPGAEFFVELTDYFPTSAR